MDTAMYACDSGYATAITLEIGMCAPAPRSDNVPIGTTCAASCISSDGNGSAKCICGYNTAGSSYCNLMAGDDYW
jgi:hypothetical protein